MGWTVGRVRWPRHRCPVRVFTDLYYDPWEQFAGPSADGASLWTFSETSEELKQWDASDLSLMTTHTPTVDSPLEAGIGGSNLAISPTHVFFVDQDSGTDYHLRRASLSTGSVDDLVNVGSSSPEGMTYCHVDDRLYVVVVDGSDWDLIRYDDDGTNATVMVAGNTDYLLPPVWTSSYVWTMRTTDLIRVRISDGDVTTFGVTGGVAYSNALHSNGRVVGQYAVGIDPPPPNDFDNWYFQWAESGAETIVNDRVIGVEFEDEVVGHGYYAPIDPTEGGCPRFVFSGAVGMGGVIGGPYPGKQDASGTSWFVEGFGFYGALWRFG